MIILGAEAKEVPKVFRPFDSAYKATPVIERNKYLMEWLAKGFTHKEVELIQSLEKKGFTLSYHAEKRLIEKTSNRSFEMKNIERAIDERDKFNYLEKGMVQRGFYDEESKTFVAVSKEGKVITWFKPEPGYINKKKVEYFNYMKK